MVMASGPCNRGEWEPESEWLARYKRTCPDWREQGLGTPTAQDYADTFGYGLALVGVGALAVGYFIWRATRRKSAISGLRMRRMKGRRL